MKLCPHCEFIYEDDQSLCDMDGQVLVDHNASAVFPERIPAEKQISRKSSLTGFILPAGVGLLLAGVLCIAYYASPNPVNSKTERRSLTPAAQEYDINSPRPDPQQETPLSESSQSESFPVSAAPDPSPALSITKAQEATRNPVVDTAAHTRVKDSDKRLNIGRSVPPLPRLRPLPRLPDAKPVKKNSNSANRMPAKLTRQKAKGESATSTRKDSKLRSFLKKTGRILKKPFKL